MKYRKYNLKYWIGRIHLWLGLASGLVVFIVAITGCIYVFQDELRDLTENHRKVPIQDQPFLLPTSLRANALKTYPEATASAIIYQGKDRSASVFLKVGQEYHYIFLNPYTGQFLYDENLQKDFFTLVEYMHLYLLLPAAIGKPIVDISVLIFVILLVTGLILWWPGRKNRRKQNFVIKWNGRWRRVNYDMHRVLGFYISAIIFVIALTGLSMSYTWVRNGLNAIANGGKKYLLESDYPSSDTLLPKANQPALDNSFLYAARKSSLAEMFIVYSGEKATDPIVVTAYAKTLHYYRADNYFFDKSGGKLLKEMPFNKKSAGLRLNEMTYDLHTGQLLGTGGKIAAFLASLLAASLPVTGVLIWWGRKKKKKIAQSPTEIVLS